MSPSQRPSQRAAPPARPAPGRLKFRILLLAYVALSLLVFWLLQRYMLRIAALYDYDIRNDFVQFGLYFLIYVVLAALAYAVVRRMPLSDEVQLRLVFLGCLTLSATVAIYQSRFGQTPFAKLVKFNNFFNVGSLGAFGTVLWLTWRRFGMVELIAPPAKALASQVARGHAEISLADGLWDRLKRLVELLVALIVLIVSLPLALLLLVLIWLEDPGPIFVAKVAVGRGGPSFRQYKLRSMIKDAEGGTGPVPAAPSDARVTRLGNLLRRTHIDELPQLFNILRGDMSLVGPRPERTVFVARHLETVPDYALRHAVRPGLAGLAQVYGDYYSTPREKLRYDRLYIANRGPGLDLQLLSAAVVLALFGIPPRRRKGGRKRHRRESARWRRAYRALRGDELPDEPE